jgi:hypothetical protein
LPITGPTGLPLSPSRPSLPKFASSTFPIKIRLVDLPPNRMQPRYVEHLERLVETCWEEFTEDQPERVKLFEEGGWTLEAELYESREVLLRGQEQATETTMRAFFIDDNDDPILFDSFSFIDSLIWGLANISRSQGFGFPFYPFDHLDPKERPIIYIFCSSLAPFEAYRRFRDRYRWLKKTASGWVSKFPFSDRPLINVRLVGYASEDPARQQLVDDLAQLRRDGGSWVEAVDEWRWVREDGKLTRVMRSDSDLEDREGLKGSDNG